MPNKTIKCQKHGEIIIDADWGDDCPICLDKTWMNENNQNLPKSTTSVNREIKYKTFENKVIDLFRENGKLVSKLIIDASKGEYKIYFKQKKTER